MFRFSNKKALSQGLKCRVQLIVPNEEIEVSYNNNSIGQDILNDVVSQLNLLDKDYFGLKLFDHIQWLDLTKPIAKQTKGFDNVIFVLRFKYYPAEPALLANESTRYYLYLQLRSDLLEGRLRTESQETSTYLIACIIQSELGDASSSNPNDNYVTEFKFIPNQSEELELASIRLHKSEDFLGLTPTDAELNFLKKACQLDTYGIDPYPVKEGSSHRHCLIGVNHRGISTFRDSKRTALYDWDEIERITLDSKLVLIYCRRIEKLSEKKSKTQRSLLGFRCPSHEHAYNFWKAAVEHRYFFTLETTPDLPIVTNTGGLFRKSHKLKYVGRVEKDLLRDHVDESRCIGVRRSRSLVVKAGDGPHWQGFHDGNTSLQQGSMNNLYSSNIINKTLPSNMNYLCEEDEDRFNEEMSAGQEQQGPVGDKNKRASLASDSKDSQKTFKRKSVLTTKTEAEGHAIRRGSQVYMDTEQQHHDFIKASIILIFTLASILLVILLISDSERPNSISLMVKKMNLEHVSTTLRQNYYLPLKSGLRLTFERILAILDSKLI